jgi:hypothetical protein
LSDFVLSQATYIDVHNNQKITVPLGILVPLILSKQTGYNLAEMQDECRLDEIPPLDSIIQSLLAETIPLPRYKDHVASDASY